jgi:putative transposase
VAIDEAHFCAALRYIALNPVRARLVGRPKAWGWSNVHAHLTGSADGLTEVAPVLERYPRFMDLLESGPDDDAFIRLRQAESIGRPLGDDNFIAQLEALTQRHLKPAKRGPKPTEREGS